MTDNFSKNNFFFQKGELNFKGKITRIIKSWDGSRGDHFLFGLVFIKKKVT